jgi:hypothetical protein
MPVNGGEAASLVESALLLRWRAPELALLLADRAVTAAQDDKMAVLRADHLAVFALNRLGRHGEAAHRLFPAIRDPDTPPWLRHELHLELAHCAAALGETVTALGAVRAVLAAGDDVAPALRGGALVAVAEASFALNPDNLVTSALEEADELYREDSSLDHDTALLLRAAARAADAVRHRRRGKTAEAEVKAREGRELLAALADPDHDSGEVSARLMLEIVLALLDRDAGEVATEEARPLLRRPVRAAAAGSVGRLRLALATRVHLAEGRHEPALTLLADAVEGAQRYGVDAVLAECLEGLSHVHEARGEFADALHCVRAARAAECRDRHDLEAARSVLLENCGSARREETRLISQVAALVGNTGTAGGGSESDTGPMKVDIAAEVAVHRPVQPEAGEPEAAEPETAEPEVAEPEVAEPEAAEPEAAEPEAAEPEAAEPEAAEPELGGEGPADLQSVESPSGLDTWRSGARHRRGASTLVLVSDLLPASALSAGRSGRRRAEEADEERVEETSAVEAQQPVGDATDSGPGGTESAPATLREFPVFGPPPAPTPRALEWDSADDDSAATEASVDENDDSADDDEAHQMGLGDLLAEALAAYQQSRDVHAESRTTAMLGKDNGAAPDVETSREGPRYGGLATRWPAGLTLAPEVMDRHDDDPSEAVTNPLLRLPDLTAEPRWAPPETGRRSAAGD